LYIKPRVVIAPEWSWLAAFNIASSLGNDRAKYERDELAQKLTPSQLVNAQKLARDWMDETKKK
jgi:hypothetical protein